VCQNCTGNSNAPEGSDKHTDCTCNAGATGNDGQECILCAAGKYKILTGNAACTDCVVGKYYTKISAFSDECVTCPARSDALAGSPARTNCSCNAGSSGVNGETCAICPAGKFSELGASKYYWVVIQDLQVR